MSNYNDNGCGCEKNPPCLGCVEEDSSANRLHLYAVWTIASDTSETEKWGKQSDEGDNRREKEAEDLSRLWFLFRDAKALNLKENKS